MSVPTNDTFRLDKIWEIAHRLDNDTFSVNDVQLVREILVKAVDEIEDLAKPARSEVFHWACELDRENRALTEKLEQLRLAARQQGANL